jgi:hypothetical protein
MRADKATNIANWTKALVENPLQTERDLADSIWVSNWTAHNIKKEIEQKWAKDDRIIGITDTDLSILTIGQREIERRLNDKEEVEKMRTVEISQVIKESTARYSLFRWNATDSEWGLKGIDSIDIL